MRFYVKLKSFHMVTQQHTKIQAENQTPSEQNLVKKKYGK